MYYILRTTDPWDGYIARVEYRDDDPFRFWNIGEVFEQAPELPLRARVITDDKTVLPDMWETPLPMMSVRLYETLCAMGIRNLDTYPVELTDSRSGEVIEGYIAFNLIGVIAATDTDKTRFAEGTTDRLISAGVDHLVLDPEKIGQARMFRLAESVSTIIVDQAIRDGLSGENFPTLTFYKPEDWVGI